MTGEKIPADIQHKHVDSPFFSIITVTYNNYENLVTTYKSIFNQTNHQFEWIVIDGASKDNTVEFLKSLAKENFYYLSEKDAGLYDAMNKGILRAKGEFIIFLNAGDEFSEVETLDKVKNKFDTSKDNDAIDFIYGDSEEADLDGNVFYRKSRSFWRRKMGMFTHHQAMFYRRKLLNEHKIFYNQKYNIAGDYDFTLHNLKYIKSYLYIPIPICTFLQGGLSHQHWKAGLAQCGEIRSNYLGMNILFIKLIYIYQYLLHIFRFKFTGVYNFLRFRRMN